jgi:hypothetical protein
MYSYQSFKKQITFSLRMETIHFRAVIEVLGKPQKHVEDSLNGYIKKITEQPAFEVLSKEIAAAAEQDNELWATHAELEIKTKELAFLTRFCLEYMPSAVEIIAPKSLTLDESELTNFLSDLQVKLHGVDLVAKQAKMQADTYRSNLGNLMSNYIKLLLTQKPLTAEQLSKLTGVQFDLIGDFLDAMIDRNQIDLEQDTYHLKKKEDVQNGVKRETD